MNDPQISDIFERRAFPGPSEPAKLISTHISWVILTPEYSFKIKKPVHFHFLDFSTPALRAHYCREEVRLNRRLAPDTYLGVLPIGRKDGQLRIGARNRPAEDYAVWMRREDNTRELDVLLRDGAVQPTDMKKLAHKLAAFHQAHTLRRIRVDPQELRADFADLFPYAESLSAALGPETAPIFYKMNTWLPGFIERHTKRLCNRTREGFRVEGHGDLHSRNIFLTEEPVLFDCIEFNPHMRRIDVLDELAFLAMDLDFYRRPDLSDALLRYYQEKHPCILVPEDETLFLFFKTYRANVRLKVTLLAGISAPGAVETMRRYWELLAEYWKQIEKQ